MNIACKFHVSLFLILPALAMTGASPARADVKMPGLFADHMVLQRDAKVPVWGWAAAGEQVTVECNGQTQSATADAAGAWRVDLDNLKVGGPYVLNVAGKNHLAFSDVLVGDVWLCSGQSNMGFAMSWLRDSQYVNDIETADFPTIRQANVGHKPSVQPQANVEVKWTVCSPQTVGDFTAAGFYFARDLQQELKIPIGLVHSSWGGTSIEAWTSLEALNTVPSFKKRAEGQIANLNQLPGQIKAFPGAISAWEQKYGRVDAGNEGEKRGWAAMDADTSDWKPMKLNTRWRDAGLPNGGIAWLRKEIDLPASAAAKGFRLDWGVIDEQYETTYFNGEKLGESGHNPPEFYCGYKGHMVPGKLVKAGKNVLAIRFVADTGERAGLSKKASGLGFSSLGVKDVSDDCLVKIELAFPPLSKQALSERPPCPRGDGVHTSSAALRRDDSPADPFCHQRLHLVSGRTGWEQGPRLSKIAPPDDSGLALALGPGRISLLHPAVAQLAGSQK